MFTYLFKIMLHIVNLDASGGALEQDSPRVLGQWNGTDEDHDCDEHARRRVRVEPGLGTRLPDDDGCDDDTNIVDGVADDMDENTEHAEVTAGLLRLSRVMTVLCMSADGLWHWSAHETVGECMCFSSAALTFALFEVVFLTGSRFTTAASPWS